MAHDIATTIIQMADLKVKEEQENSKARFIEKCRSNRYVIEMEIRTSYKYTNDDGVDANRGTCDSSFALMYNVDGNLYMDKTELIYCEGDLTQRFTIGVGEIFREPLIKKIIKVDNANELNDFMEDMSLFVPDDLQNKRDFNTIIRIGIYDGTDEDAIISLDDYPYLYSKVIKLSDYNNHDEGRAKLMEYAFNFLSKVIVL
jgi:hypothetical protein